MEEKFSLKQNAFITFMLNYSSVLLTGVILMIFLAKFGLPDVIDKVICGCFFVAAIFNGCRKLKGNNRFLIISDKCIRILKYKKKQPVVISQYSNEEIKDIEYSGDGIYVLTKTDNSKELIALSYGLVPPNSLSLKVNAILKTILNERFHIESENKENDENDLYEYIETKTIPLSVKDKDSSTRNLRVFYAVFGLILVIIPTILGILVGLMLILEVLKLILATIMAIL